MPRPSCEPCCNPTELSRVQSSYRAAVLEILCSIEANGGGSGGGPNRIDVEILCDPGTGDPVIYSYNYETDGTRGAPTAYNLDGSPYAGVIADLVACGSGAASTSLLEYIICDNKVNKIVQIPVTGATPGSPTYLLLDRTASAAPADWSLVQAGGCQGIYAEDSAHVSGDRGQFVLAVANDGTNFGAIGDYTPLAVATSGSLFITDDYNTVPSSVLGRSSVKAEDSAHVSGNGGKAILGVRRDSLAVQTSADGDYSFPSQDSFGRELVNPFAPQGAYRFGNISVTDTTSTQVIAAAGAGIRIYVTNISISNTGGTDVLITFQDGSGGATLWRTIAPTLGGSNISFQVPFFTTANTALFVAAGGSSTTVYISVSGFIAP